MSWRPYNTSDAEDFYGRTPVRGIYANNNSEDMWPADLLATIPDDVLVAECKRRGLEVQA